MIKQALFIAALGTAAFVPVPGRAEVLTERLVVTNHQAFATLSVAYDGGPKLPLLTRAGGQDLIGDIVRAR